MRDRNQVVKLVESWVGKNEKDGSHKEIIDIYNSFENRHALPRGIKMQLNWAWCAATWSALAIKLGYEDIMPIEISCGFLIEEAKKMGCWVEEDSYIPKPGDACLYDWKDNGIGENTGWPDHVGTVTYVNEKAGYFVVTEGNYNDSVKKRTVSINGKFIRGFITPKYDEVEELDPIDIVMNRPIQPISTIAKEVIAGMWGNYPNRKEKIEKAGYNYSQVQAEVNRILNRNSEVEASKNPKPDTSFTQPTRKTVEASCYASSFDKKLAGTYETTANLHCRNDAGTNKKSLVLIPKGSPVKCYGFYSNFSGACWLLIESHINGVRYVGFSHSSYLVKVE